MHLNAKPSTFRNARKLRSDMTSAETILWSALKNRQVGGFKFRRQHAISRYVLDFYCHKVKFGIELDGPYHLEKSQQFYDTDRTQNLALFNIEIIRFENIEVIESISKALNIIKEKCIHRASLNLK